MIRSYFGLSVQPFAPEKIALLPHQQEIFNTLMVHCQQGGLCLLLGEPGTGKSAIRNALAKHDEKRLIVPVVSRTLHTWRNILRILCGAFGVDFFNDVFQCEKKLIEEAFRLNRLGKMIAPVIDDVHFLDIDSLRRLRLLMEDFPKNHNLILIGQPSLLQTLLLSINEDIKSRVTYSTILKKLAPEAIERFILDQLDLAGLAHTAFTDQALALIVRSSDGVLRKTRNLCIACLLEAVRDQVRSVDLKQVNRALMQPHWRTESDLNLIP
jgi:type II secretory pathway predicted ATPase ExeA